MKIEDIKYNLILKKNSLIDRIKGVNRKRVSAYAVLVFMLALLPATVFLTQRINNVNKQAASCGGVSAFLTFTDFNGNTITRANQGDRFRVNLFLTGELDAADISINFENNKIQPPAGGFQMDGGGNFYFSQAGIPLDNLLTVSLLRNYKASRSINRKIASADFTVITSQATTAVFQFVEPTVFANMGQGKDLSCARNKNLALNQEEPNTPQETANRCDGYSYNCLDATSQTCSGNWDDSKSCGAGKRCCVPASAVTTTPALSKTGCPNYWTNCKRKDLGETCSGAWNDDYGCGDNFTCCIPDSVSASPFVPVTTVVPSVTSSTASPTSTLTPTPTVKPACPNYWTNCKRKDLGETCSGAWNDDYGCGDNFTCCIP